MTDEYGYSSTIDCGAASCGLAHIDGLRGRASESLHGPVPNSDLGTKHVCFPGRGPLKYKMTALFLATVYPHVFALFLPHFSSLNTDALANLGRAPVTSGSAGNAVARTRQLPFADVGQRRRRAR